MSYRLLDVEPSPDLVRRLVFVPFLPNGTCVAAPAGRGRLRLPAGEVRAGEDWLLDTCLRVPMETVSFRMQRAHPFAADGTTLYVWLDGDRRDRRPQVEPVTGPPEEIAGRLAREGAVGEAQAVRDGTRSFAQQTDADYYAGNLRLLEPAYLRGRTVQAGSGFSGDATQWRARREMIVDGIHRDGTFLDLGCANGLLMESVRQWAADRGVDIEPYGVDLAPGLVALARQRLPQWADRIEVGNAIDYRPADGRRFTFVHLMLDLVPVHRRADLVRHGLSLVGPGGRLLVSHYRAGDTDPSASRHLHDLGFPVAGSAADASSRAETAWLPVPTPPSI